MNRKLTAALFALGIAGISCDGFSPSAPVEGSSSALPSVDAAPPGFVAEKPPAPAGELDDAVAQVLARLQARHTGMPEREHLTLATTIVEQAALHDVDHVLVMAVIEVESNFYHRAVSSVGAIGLMQLMPGTAEELANTFGLLWRGSDSLYDPILNVKLGVAYLRQLEDRFGTMNAALAAYNWGPGRIQRRLRSGKTLPVIYVEQVMSRYQRTNRTS